MAMNMSMDAVGAGAVAESGSLHDREHHELAPLQKAPFDFGLIRRNALLAQTGLKMPIAMKTGTTIAGVVFKDGVVLGADTRATEGSIVADKHCPKIHNISKFIHCCGAGTSADTESVTRLIQSQLELHRLNTGREPRVVTALTRLKQRLFQYQGHISAALVLGGIDSTGAHLYTVYPHGSTDSLPFATMGSGSLAAMAVFEARYRDDLNEEEAKQLVHDAICSGIYNDLGSGGDVNLMVISRTTGATYLPKFGGEKNPRLYNRKAGYAFKRGSTEWLKETERILKSSIVVTDVSSSSSSSSSSGMAVEVQ